LVYGSAACLCKMTEMHVDTENYSKFMKSIEILTGLSQDIRYWTYNDRSAWFYILNLQYISILQLTDEYFRGVASIFDAMLPLTVS